MPKVGLRIIRGNIEILSEFIRSQGAYYTWGHIIHGNLWCWISLPKSKHKQRGQHKMLFIKEVSKGEYIIMGYFNYRHIQRKSLESTGGED